MESRLRLFSDPARPDPRPNRSETLDHLRFAGLSVLLAEDNPVNQLVAKRLLQRIGIVPDVANDGVEAVTRCGEKSYDLVLMDLQMPSMDGLEATRTIRASPLPKQPAIVALTADVLQEEETRAHEAGMDAFLTKPIRPDQLLKTIASMTNH